LAAEISDAGVNGLSIVLEKVKPVQLKLKEWFSNLPDCLSMEATQVMKLNSVGYLRLAYIATEITLHRRILSSLSTATDPQLYRFCRSVAHDRFMFAIDFVQSLKPQHLSSFWYFASPQNFALIGVFGTLLLSTVSTTEEGDFYRTKLREYRWTLKINSENGAKYMKPAMALLDANLSLLSEAGNPVPSHPPIPPENGCVTSDITDQYAFSNAHLSSNGDFNSPGQYSFDPAYYPPQHTVTASPVGYHPVSSIDSHSHEFGYGIEGNSGPWPSY
jgi:hypothetical protein